MRFELYLTGSLGLTLGKYSLSVELSTAYWRIYKRVDKERGIIMLHLGPLFISLLDDDKTNAWFDKLIEKGAEQNEVN